MGIIQTIWNGICDFLENVVDFICVVINGILNPTLTPKKNF